MCGLVTYFNYAREAPALDIPSLVRVRDAMAVRGPDAKGQWISDGGQVAMGHRRLSIIDLSDRADQPMRSTDGELAIVFNGEIYNYAELRNELKAGYSFSTHSDTEVVLAAYRADPESFMDTLEGMYAFVIWDAPRKRIVAARDPYGIKPLYYADDGRTLRIASQVRALRQCAEVSGELDPEAAYGFFCWGYVPEPRTLFRSIRSLPAGHRMVVEEGGRACISSFADVASAFEVPPTRADPEEAAAGIADALHRSIKRHLVADVPVGVFLSAGIDSTTLASELTALSPTPPQAVTLEFTEYAGTAHDEGSLARTVAGELGIPHHTEGLDERAFFEQLEPALANMDQPSVDGINTYFASLAAKNAGLKTVVSGVGGDELFAGYDIFRELPRWHALRRMLPTLRPLGPVIRASVGLMRSFDWGRRRIPPKLAGIAETSADMRDLYTLRRGLFLPHEARRLVHEITGLEIDRDLHPTDVLQWHDGWSGKPNYKNIAAAESTLYLRNQLLRDSDWASMAHSLELRTPLVDYKLLCETAPLLAGLPGVSKALLRSRVPRTYDHAVRERRKTGFNTPVDDWIGRSGLMDAQPREGRSSRDWSRFVFERYLEGWARA